MKKISVLFLVMALALVSCKKCKDENPRAIIVNNGTTSVSVQIQTSGGNTENINNIGANTSSEYVTYEAGIVVFKTVVGSGNTAQETVKSVEMEQCFEYEIQIDENNNITSVPTDRNE